MNESAYGNEDYICKRVENLSYGQEYCRLKKEKGYILISFEQTLSGHYVIELKKDTENVTLNLHNR